MPTKTTVAVLTTALLAGCSTRFDTLIPDRRPDYRESKVSHTKLEVPPDLTASSIDDTLAVPDMQPTNSARLSAYTNERSKTPVPMAKTDTTSVLPAQTGLRVEQDGDRRWLVVSATPEQLWPKVRDFWVNNGLPLKRDEPTIGIMETDWLENRADIPQDGVRSILRKYLDILYAAPTRDKFRVRFERAATGKETALYLSHQGVEEVAVGGSSASSSHTYRWQNRPASPELEAEMLNRLMVALGAAEKRIDPQVKAPSTTTMHVQRVDQEGEQRLIIADDYARTWRLVGLALDGSHYAVEEQDRTQGLYVVAYHDPEQEGSSARDEGFFAKLAFWRSTSGPAPGVRYRVRLSDQGKETIVVVRNANDQPEDSSSTRQVLDVLQKTIR